MLRPPKNVAPHLLFRRLLALPRPSVTIEHRISGAEHLPLRVQALTAAELEGSEVEVVLKSLRMGPHAAFTSAEAVSSLPASELQRLMRAIYQGLGQCSPVEGRSSTKAWQRVLVEGAEHVTNARDAFALGSSVEVVDRWIVPRPERFFGVPARELVDAHHFAFHAAAVIYARSHKK